MKHIYASFLSAIICLVSFNTIAQSVATWNTFGQTAYGTQGLAPSTKDANVTVVGLTRGSGVSVSGTAAGNVWGGAGWSAVSASDAITNNKFITFSITPNSGYSMSLTSINPFLIRISATGPINILIQYQVGAGSFIDIGTQSITRPSATTNFTLASTDLSTISDLQNVSSTVTFRIIPYTSTSTGGTFYIGSQANVTSLGVNGTVSTSGPDVTPPVVSTLSPANNATGVVINTQLQIVFNENIQKGTGNIVVKKFSDNSVVQTVDVTTAAVSVSNKTATITINTLAASTSYYIEVDAGAFKDIAGNNFAGISGNSIWKFDTQSPDVTPPTVTSLTPANNATAVAPNTTLQIVFNEPIQKGTSGNIVIKNFSDNSIVQTIAVTSPSVTISGSTATISINTLSFNTSYYVEIDAGAFQDISSNNFAGISGNATWKFTTDVQPAVGIIGFNYNFNNCGQYVAQGFRAYNVLGAEVWSCTNFGRTYSGTGTSSDSALQINGFSTAAQNNEDWLISPAYDLSGATTPYLRFYSRSKFLGPDLVLKASTNYPGYGNPNAYTWTTLNGKFPAPNADVWTLSDSIYLSSYLVPNVHLAWVYTSTTGTNTAARWTLDDIRVSVGCTPPSTQPTSLNLTPSIISITGSFTGAAAPADAYLVIRSLSPTLTAQPEPGTAYAIDDLIGNGTVVSIGNNVSFTVNNLNPSTQYYFFVYAYSNSNSCYNLTNPLTGNVTTNSSPSCTPPTVQATNLSGTVTGSSIDLTYTRGNGDNILVVARKNSSVNQNPIVGVNYSTGSEIGSGNFVIYNGPAANFSYTSLPQNTTYYFALYEYYNTNYCYNLTPLTNNFTTSCVNPVNVTSLNAVPGNTIVNISWVNPTASCYNEILVVASNAPITGQGSDFTGTANSVYGGPNQVVYRGTGTSITVTSLTNGTNYYFTVFTRNGATYSSGISTTATPFDPASGFVYLFGNLHSHSSYSDGNKDDLSKKPIDDYKYARDANCMDFLGISEHNHLTAGLSKSNYPLGYADANAVNGVVSPTTGNSIVTLWGMEWGVINNGGHLLVYGFDDKLIGWEGGNYDIFNAEYDYASLFNLINAQPNAFASLAHPQSTDYTNLASTPYSTSADNAIVGTAIESGPAFSTDTSYSNFPSALSYLPYYRSLLAKGYHLGASMDGDNHNLTFGRQSTNRLVVMATSKSRADIVSAMREMRFYASNDCNARLDYKIYNNVMGSSVVHSSVPNITVNVTDPDVSDSVINISIFGAKVGDPAPTTAIKQYNGVSFASFGISDAANTQPDNTTFYYYLIITQQDGNKIISSPIWYTRSDAVLPVSLFNFKGAYNKTNKTSLLSWSTAQEINSKAFILERSTDGGRNFIPIGSINAKGNSSITSNYDFTDLSPVTGTNLYRLKQIDLDNKFDYSNVVSIIVRDKEADYYSLYPNPAHGFTYLNSTSTQNKMIHFQMADASGRILKDQLNQIDNNHPIKLNLDGVSQGVYFIKISSEGTTSTERIVVK